MAKSCGGSRRGGCGEPSRQAGWLLGALLGSVLCAGGCTTDLSGAEAFKGQVGRLQTIQREAWLQGEREPYDLMIHPDGWAPAGVEKTVPGESVICIREVRFNPHAGYGGATALGLIWVSPDEPAVEFRAKWGWYKELYPAAWEPPDTPAKRFIDEQGRWAPDPRLDDASTYPTTQ